MIRADNRKEDQLREITFELDYVAHPEGSVLASFGQTRVLCNVSVQEGVPPWMRNDDKPGGWITAEYSMLPRSTHTRVDREVRGRRGRTYEIQRLIGRALRAGFDLTKLGPRTCIVDCDVIQADGGTRTTAITGGYLALRIALQKLIESGDLDGSAILSPVAAVSVGVLEDNPILDLCYEEDLNAEVDANIVMNADGEYIEIQGTAEEKPFSPANLNVMLELAASGIREIIEKQNSVLKDA